MIEDITLSKVLQKMSEINSMTIIGEPDNFLVLPQISHSEGVNLTLKDVVILVDIYKQKHPKTDIKSMNESILAVDIMEMLNYSIPAPENWEIKYAVNRRNKRINKL